TSSCPIRPRTVCSANASQALLARAGSADFSFRAKPCTADSPSIAAARIEWGYNKRMARERAGWQCPHLRDNVILQRREQIIRIERLGDESACAVGEHAPAGRLLPVGGEYEDGKGGKPGLFLIAADAGDGIEPVQYGHVEVHERQIVFSRGMGERVDSRPPVENDRNLMPCPRERRAHQHCVDLVVLRD